MVALIACLNFLTHLEEPRGPVWDESYYLASTQRYLEGTTQFASHPPLGLMLIAAGDAASGANARLDTHALGRDKKVPGADIPPGYDFAGVRVASGVFGVLGALAFFALMQALVRQPVTAALFSSLYLFDNALIAQFRAAHLDAFQITFCLSALVCFVHAFRREGRAAPGLDLGLAVSCALASMVRANGIILILLAVMLVGRRLLVRHRRGGDWAFGRALREGLAMSAGFLVTATGIFVLHLTITTASPQYGSPAASQDARFITGAYDQFLRLRRPMSPEVVLTAARDYANAMNADLQGVGMVDANGSAVLGWPFGQSPINYRWDADDHATRYVQLTPNPVGWWVGVLGVAGAAMIVLTRWASHRTEPGRETKLMAALLALYAAFMALHLWLEATRVLYLYHYFIGLMISFALAALVFRQACRRWRAFGRIAGVVLAVFTALQVAAFSFYAPLTYHQPLTHDACRLRNLAMHVVDCR